MIRGMYSAAAGMTAQYKKINVLANNAANVNTTGFKQTRLSLTDFGDELTTRTSDGQEVGSLPYKVVLGGETTDLSQGSLKSTGLGTDLAVSGDGFFAVEAAGGVKYTRSGDFTVDAQGFLALPTGERLLGQNGAPLAVGSSNFTVGTDGTVRLMNGTADRINLFTAADPVRRPDGFFDLAGAVPAGGMIRQGWLEESNTDVVKNMTDLLAATRSFQGSQQAFQVSDAAFEKLVTQVGTLK